MSATGSRGRAGGGDRRGRGGKESSTHARFKGEWKQHTTRQVGEEKVCPVGYRTLEQLLAKDPDDSCLELASLKLGLRKLLQCPDIRFDLMAVLCQVFGRVCKAQFSSATLNMLLSLISETEFLSKHLPCFLSMVMTVDGYNRLTRLDAMPRCIEDIGQVLSAMHHRFPGHHTEISQAQSELRDIVSYNAGRIDIEQVVFRVTKTEKSKQTTQTKRRGSAPDYFREVDVLPTTQELSEAGSRPFLRENIRSGEYDSVDHYLDVQFRLLREDLVGPLREGIMQYRQGKHDLDIHVYHNVTLEEPLYSHTGVTFRIHFDETKLKGVLWKSSKRLIYGSLVVLSADYFKTSIFCTVARSHAEDLVHGLVEIKLERDGDVAGMLSNGTFIMAESPAYFEAYRHVLSRLQQVTNQTLPFVDYIVSASQDMLTPAYVRHHTKYDLSALASRKNTFDYPCLRSASILDVVAWERLQPLIDLNPSQLHAVRVALTHEMAIIQGPPGTGKTHVGLKIVQVLLENSHVWRNTSFGTATKPNQSNHPILLVCYTNHALDQFLEGVAKFHSDGIVRIGGRSSSEVLKQYNLTSLRSADRECVPRHLRRRTGELRGEIEHLATEVKGPQETLVMAKNEVLHENVLSEHMTTAQYSSLTRSRASVSSHKSKMLVWLSEEDEAGLNDDETQGRDDGEDDSAQSEDDNLDVMEEADFVREMRTLEVDNYPCKVIVGKRQAGIQENPLAVRAHFQGLKKHNKNMQKNLQRRLRGTESMSEKEAKTVKNVWSIRNNRDRWRLYRYWVESYCQEARLKLISIQQEFTALCEELREVNSQKDFEIIRHADVVGMTTTGAAKFHVLLQRIRPCIIVVEEAAEVLEAHIVTSLTESCQHMILIGDHQQLRPSPTMYELAKNYNLDISLFERMINNRIPHQQLNIQHRMRPEISRFMKLQRLYPNLQDDTSVMKFEDIRGVSKNVYFIRHEKREDSKKNKNSRSHSNTHEATFLAGLCNYLLQQGYPARKVTILTTYSGQLTVFKQHMKKSDFEGVQVTTVDNYQGEENDIILLSLVRSNAEGKAGFLKTDNRVCVALSRAKKGMYCIGDFTLLADRKRRSLWREIVDISKGKGQIGNSLPLKCQNHPENITEVAKHQDFSEKVPGGGCLLQCGALLTCGHRCDLRCHMEARVHETYVCRRNCTQMCPGGHPCKKLCYQSCDVPCMIAVMKTLPCGHTQPLPCYKDVREVACDKPCTRQLQCGHPCKRPCCQSCDVPCMIKVTKTLPCGHTHPLPCYKDVREVACDKPCTRQLQCGHPCKRLCYQSCGVPCMIKVTKTLPCGHTQPLPCYKDVREVACDKPCTRQLQCGHPCKNACCERCTTMCPVIVTRDDWPCGHNVTVRCSDGPESCPIACAATLSCDHQCKGTCGSCRRGRFHEACMQPCGRTLLCGHPCPRECSQDCALCLEPCANGCQHGECNRACGDPCVPCLAACKWKCSHKTCKRRCGEPCRRPPCDKPCNLLLACGHRCIGFCGEPCPSRCTACETRGIAEYSAEHTEPHKKTQESRFIVLEDCGHLAEADFLDQWMCRGDNGCPISLQLKMCPCCGTLIRHNVRHGGAIKQTLRDIEVVKTRLRVDSPENERRRRSLQRRILAESNKFFGARGSMFPTPATARRFLNSIDSRIESCGDLHSLEHRVALLQELNNIEKLLQQQLHMSPGSKACAEHLLSDVTIARKWACHEPINRLSQQQADDANREVRRLHLGVSFLRVTGHKPSCHLSVIHRLITTRRCFMDSSQLTSAREEEISSILKVISERAGARSVPVEEWKVLAPVPGFNRDGWFTCGEGHVYHAGESNDANIKCPECRRNNGSIVNKLKSCVVS